MWINARDLDQQESRIPEWARQAVQAAHQQALREGSVYVVAQEGAWTGIVEIFPDGRRHRLKPLAHPTHVRVGTQARLS